MSKARDQGYALVDSETERVVARSSHLEPLVAASDLVPGRFYRILKADAQFGVMEVQA